MDCEKTEEESNIITRKRVKIAALALVLTLVLLHKQILIGVASFMTIRDPVEAADIILPLYHEGQTVPFAAGELYRQGYAKFVAVVKTKPGRLQALGLLPPADKVWRRILEREGVPSDAIVTIPSDSANTIELSKALSAFLRTRGMRSVIILASAPLSRIVRSDLRQGFAGSPIRLYTYPVPLWEFSEKNWWRFRHGWITYFDVYYLWLVRLLRD